MNITFQIKKATPPLVTDREEAGDIVDVFLTPSSGTMPNAGVKFYYVHVTGVPDAGAARLRRIRQKLQEPDLEQFATDDDGTPLFRKRNSRKWAIPAGAIPRNARQALSRDGQITVTWANAKPFILRKRAKIQRDAEFDRAAFDEITDQDLSNA